MKVAYLSKSSSMLDLTQILNRYGYSNQNRKQHRNVLIVDDEPSFLYLYNRRLQTYASNWHIYQVCGGQQALAFLEQESVDVMLLDLIMPEINGLIVLKSMGHRVNENLLVIMLANEV